MRQGSLYVHVSGGLLTPAVVADLLADTTREKNFEASSFASPGQSSPTTASHAQAIQDAWELACSVYDEVQSKLDTFSDAKSATAAWLKELLFALDWTKVDPAKSDQVHNHGGPAPVVLTATPPDQFAPEGISYHDRLQDYLNQHPERWGLLVSPRQLRVVREFHHSTIKAFVAFDLDAIFEARDFPAFRAMYRLAHPSRFVGGDDAPLEKLFARSQKDGIAVGAALQKQVRIALHELANGLIGPELRAEMADPKAARAVFRELLLLTYRLLFLLFAEQRQMVPTNGLYPESYSVERLLRLVDNPRVAPHHHDLWEGLKVTFRMLYYGDPVTGVYGYSGQFFDPAEVPHLGDATCSNRALLRALKALAWVEVGGLTQRINYGLMAQAGVEEHLTSTGLDELGSVYESLLGYTLRIADKKLLVDGRDVAAHEVYLASLSTERKDLGAFYTPPELVDFVLTQSLDLLIKERLETAGDSPAAREATLLDLRVADPSCGAGTFLIATIDRIGMALAKVRAPDGRPSEQQIQVARRDVLSHCIYGVDKDRFAAELCKFALWVHCAVKDLPLSFLDHRIQHGDALVGWPLGELPREIPSEAFNVPSTVRSAKDTESRVLRDFLDRSRVLNDEARQLQLGKAPPPIPDLPVRFPEVLAEDERIPADVARKTKAYREHLRSSEYARWNATANLWAAAFFWNPGLGRAPTSADYWRARDGHPDPVLAEKAEDLLADFPVFHWPLRFPEIAKRGGFDCLVGNPPWEQFENREEEWFGEHVPEIAALTSAKRKDAIEALSVSNSALYRAWTNYVNANFRIAEYVRTCRRFTPTGGKPNTYLLFSELFADAVRSGGRAGVVVKSALGMDESASPVFRRLVEAGRIDVFHDFVNGGAGGRIFKAVGDPVRFAVVGLLGDETGEPLRATTFNFTVAQARTRVPIPFPKELMGVLNPHTHTLVSYRTAAELNVAVSLHRRHPILDCNDGENPWQIAYSQMFNIAGTHKKLPHKREDLESDGWILGSDMIFLGPPEASSRASAASQLGLELTGSRNPSRRRALPFYEGQMANRYDHRAKTYRGFEGDNKYGKKPGIPACSDLEKSDPRFEVEPRYWILEVDAEPRIRQVMDSRTIIGFRDVAAWYSDRRVAKGCVLPRYPAADTVPVLGVPPTSAMEFLAIFNSTPFDFLVCGHMPSNHVKTLWMLAQIPAPLPGLDPRISDHARKLSLTSYSVCAQFGVEPHPWNAEERYQLDTELDALVAHAYGLTRAEYEVVLDSFEVLARIERHEKGRYQFKDDCLAAYGRVG